MHWNDRVKQAKNDFPIYLSDNLLKKVRPEPKIIRILLKNSHESLTVASIVQDHSSLWTVVCSYYAMYYSAKSVLLSLGYKVGDKISHKVTSDAVIVLLKDRLRKSIMDSLDQARSDALEIAGVRAESLVKSFDNERAKRSRFQYEMTSKILHTKALTSFERAKEFVFEMEKLLD